MCNFELFLISEEDCEILVWFDECLLYFGFCVGLFLELELVFVNSGNNSLELFSFLEDFVYLVIVIFVY